MDMLQEGATERRHAAEIAAKDAAIHERDEVIRQNVIRDALAAALALAGIDIVYVKAVSAMLAPTVTCVRGDDGIDRAVVDGAFGEEPVARFVQAWAMSDEGRPFLKPYTGEPETSGGSNPFSADHWNVTAQGALVRAKGVEHAGKLARAAGTTLGGMRPVRGGPPMQIKANRAPTNPFSADGWNVTEQGQVARADMAKADRLAKAAGTTVGGPRPVRRAA